MELLLPGIKSTYLPRMYNCGLVVVYRSLTDSPFELGGGGGGGDGIPDLKSKGHSILESTVDLEKTEPDCVEAELRDAIHFGSKREFIEPWWMP